MLPVEGITLEGKQLGNNVREVLALIQILTNVLHTGTKQRYAAHFLKARDVAVLPGNGGKHPDANGFGPAWRHSHCNLSEKRKPPDLPSLDSPSDGLDPAGL